MPNLLFATAENAEQHLDDSLAEHAENRSSALLRPLRTSRFSCGSALSAVAPSLRPLRGSQFHAPSASSAVTLCGLCVFSLRLQRLHSAFSAVALLNGFGIDLILYLLQVSLNGAPHVDIHGHECCRHHRREHRVL